MNTLKIKTSSFKDYLSRNYTLGTTKRYSRAVRLFLGYMGNKEAVEQATYNQIINYLHTLRERKYSNSHMTAELAGLKALYTYLVIKGTRIDNPTMSIFLNDRRRNDIQYQNLFSREDLEQLLEQGSRYKLLTNRNKLAMSFYTYQALNTGEIVKLTLDDADIDKGTVFIKAGSKTNSRILPLENKQILYLDRYLHFERPKLIEKQELKSRYQGAKLLIGKLGNPVTGDQVQYLTESKRSIFPMRTLNPKTIRASVLVNLFKQGWDVKDVQLFAGHKYPSTTERYKPEDLSDLKEAVERWGLW